MFLVVALHALHDPLARHLGILVNLALILQLLLDIQRFGHVTTSLHTGSLAQHLLPLLQGRELVDIHAGPTRPNDPSDRRDVGDGDVVAYDKPGLGRLEVLVQHAVQPSRLVDVPLHAIFDFLRRVADEMVCLALHGAQTRVLPEQPVVHLVVLARTFRVADFMVRVVLVGQVCEDAAGLEQADLLAIREGVCQGRDAAVGVDFQKPRLLLPVGRDVDVFGLVRDAELFERDGDFDPVGRGVGVECDIWARHAGGGT